MKRFLLPVIGILASCVLAMAVGSSASSSIPASQPVSGAPAASTRASLADFEGDGTEASPYLIKSKADLIRLSQLSCTDNPADLPDYGGSLSSFAGTYFKMTSDIDLEYSTDFRGISSTTNSTVYAKIKFQGIFDGDGHAVKRMKVGTVTWGTRPEDSTTGIGKLNNSTSKAQAALFGVLGTGAVVKNVVIAADCRIEGTNFVAGVVGDGGKSGATIENCRNYAAITGYGQNVGGIVGYQNGATVRGCFNAGTITSGIFYAGGISGQALGTIEDCMNVGDVRVITISQESCPWLAGGIVGRTTKAITDCVNFGSVTGVKSIGGIAGQTSKPINNCMSLGIVTGEENAGVVAGDASSLGFGQSFGNCLFDSQLTTLLSVGSGSASGTQGKATAQLTSGEALSGFSTEKWQFEAGKYPVLGAFAAEDGAVKMRQIVLSLAEGETVGNVMTDATLSSADGLVWSLSEGADFSISGNTLKVPAGRTETPNVLTATFGNFTKNITIAKTDESVSGPFEGEGTEESPYLIQTKADLITLSKLTCAENSSQLATIDTFAGKFFKMTADIDLEYDEEFIGISVSSQFSYSPHVVFAGTFDGDGHQIKRMKMGGVAWTVRPEDAPDGLGTPDTEASSQYYYRSFIGRLGGTVKNLSIAADCKIEGYTSLGGIVGVMNSGSLVENCRNYANVLAWNTLAGGIAADVNKGATIRNCYNEGNITTAIMVAGGIAGRLAGTIELCANAGDVKALGLTSVVNEEVNYDMLMDVGGIVGNGTPNTNTAMIANCVNAGTIEGTKNVGGLSGTDVAMTSCVNYGIVNGSMINFTGTACGTNAGKKKEDVYYDSQTSVAKGVANGNNVSGAYATGTSLMVNGFPMIGLAPANWKFDANMYPTLVQFADEPKLYDARRIITYVSDDCTVADVLTYIVCYNVYGFTYELRDGSQFSMYGYSVQAPTKYSFHDIADTLVVTTPHLVRPVYIFKKSQLSLTGNGSEKNPFLIKNLEDWVSLANFSNNSDETFEGLYVKLQYNVNFNNQQLPTLWSRPSVPFQGTFEGNNRTLANILTSSAYVESSGVFGYIGDKGVVRNLTAQGSVSTSHAVAGGIVGTLSGKLENCMSEIVLKSTADVVGGVAGRALPGSSLTRCLNISPVSGANTVAGVVAEVAEAGVTLTECANMGAVTASGNVAGGLSAKSAASYADCYNVGDVTAASQAAGLVAVPVAGSTSLLRAYNAAAVTAADGTSGSVVAVDATDAAAWNEGNSVAEVSYVTDFGTHTIDALGNATTLAALAKADMGEGWTSDDDYSLPVFASKSYHDAVKLHSAQVILAGGDSRDKVTKHFHVGRPSGVDWLWDNDDALSISGTDATVAAYYRGKVTLTATCGKYERQVALQLDTESGVEDVDAAAEVESESWYTLTGVQVPEPECDGQLYIRVTRYTNGKVETSKVLPRK